MGRLHWLEKDGDEGRIVSESVCGEGGGGGISNELLVPFDVTQAAALEPAWRHPI